MSYTPHAYIQHPYHKPLLMKEEQWLEEATLVRVQVRVVSSTQRNRDTLSENNLIAP